MRKSSCPSPYPAQHYVVFRNTPFFRAVAFILALTIVSSCAKRYQDPPKEYAKPFALWLSDKPRQIRLASSIDEVTRRYLSRITETYRQPKELDVGKGAAGGAVMGVGEGVKGCLSPGGAIACPIILPLFLVTGLVIGGVAGALPGREIVNEYEVDLDKAKLKKLIDPIAVAFGEKDLKSSILKSIRESAEEITRHTFVIQNEYPSSEWEFPGDSSEGWVQISIQNADLIEVSDRNFQIRLNIAATARFEVAKMACEVSGINASFVSESEKLETWARNKAAKFKEQLDEGIRSLAEIATSEFFLHPDANSVLCDFYGSIAGRDYRNEWRPDIRRKFIVGKTTKREILEKYENVEFVETEFGDEFRLSLEEDIFTNFFKSNIGTLFSNKLQPYAWDYVDRTVSLSTVFDRNGELKFVWTTIDTKTALHRVDQLTLSQTTRDEALRILGRPTASSKSLNVIRYEESGFRPWQLELTFDRNEILKTVYLQKGSEIDTQTACVQAGKGSALALKLLAQKAEERGAKEKALVWGFRYKERYPSLDDLYQSHLIGELKPGQIEPIKRQAAEPWSNNECP